MGKHEDDRKERSGQDSDSRSRQKGSRREDRPVSAQKSPREAGAGTRYINGSKNLVNGPSKSNSSMTASHERDARKDDGGEASFRPVNQKTTFEAGGDFIPLELDDDEAGFVWNDDKDEKGKGKATVEEETPSRRRKGKEKDTGIEDGGVLDSPRLKRRSSRTSERELDRGTRRSRHEDDRNWERRDYDRDRDLKRKYDEYEGDDRYRAKRQKMEVKKYPWLSGLDLERCRNVAEM